MKRHICTLPVLPTAMIRTANNVSVSNAERAQTANEAGGAAMTRIHADGSENFGAGRTMTVCVTSANPYNAHLCESSGELSRIPADEICAAAPRFAECRGS